MVSSGPCTTSKVARKIALSIVAKAMLTCHRGSDARLFGHILVHGWICKNRVPLLGSLRKARRVRRPVRLGFLLAEPTRTRPVVKPTPEATGNVPV